MSMIRFWNAFTQPLLKAIAPKHIVEIGADSFLNTKKLLEYCRENGAHLTIIDPAPRADQETIPAKYAEFYQFNRNLSLDALSKIPCPNFILIDGDHNYYTVLNELRLLKNLANADSQLFPATLLHDISWPYGRRDLYYDPLTIPADWRKEHACSGIAYGKSSLVGKSGINNRLNNALEEGGAQNGVLTAVEDFLSESALDLAFYKIPAQNGLGIVLDRRAISASEELGRFAAVFDTLPGLESFVANLEHDRMQVRQTLRDERLAWHHELKELKHKHNSLSPRRGVDDAGRTRSALGAFLKRFVR